LQISRTAARLGTVGGVVEERGGGEGDEELLQGQVNYYRARAPEYDDWWERRGAFDFGPEFRAAWDRDVSQLRQALVDFGPGTDVVELAAGTGNWTRELLRLGAAVTAVDASPETLAINQAKNGALGPLTLEVADLFAYQPSRPFPAACFCFWISHVPPARTAGFWSLVDRCLAPGGRVFLIDNAHPDYATPRGPAGWRARMEAIDNTTAPPSVITERELSDGRRFDVVKRYWHPPELEAELAPLGWRATAANTDFAFLYATVERA